MLASFLHTMLKLLVQNHHIHGSQLQLHKMAANMAKANYPSLVDTLHKLLQLEHDTYIVVN